MSDRSLELAREDLELAFTAILEACGDDPTRNGVLETPARAAKFYLEATRGYRESPEELFKTFDVDAPDQMIAVGPTRFYSLCEHHTAPFYGFAWVAYIPDDRIMGLSKIPRLVQLVAARFQVQERITGDIADLIEKHLQPRGVAVRVRARHLCCEMRGIKTVAPMTTTAVRGIFKEDAAARSEWLSSCVEPSA